MDIIETFYEQHISGSVKWVSYVEALFNKQLESGHFFFCHLNISHMNQGNTQITVKLFTAENNKIGLN